MIRYHIRLLAVDRRRALWCAAHTLALAFLLTADAGAYELGSALVETSRGVQPKMVKIFGAGRGGLEAYQSGFFVSADGHVLTVWSYVLDPETVTVVLHDGRRLNGHLVGSDPELELALLKVEGDGYEYFELPATTSPEPGNRILAFSNLYGIAVGGEATSVMQGRIATIASLAARRGTFETPYRGRVFVVDAVTNNAGAAGGALTTMRGTLLGVLGKELLDTSNDVWLNYAIPADVARQGVERILHGGSPEAATDASVPIEPVVAEMLGLVMIPNVLPNTPPYIEMVRDESAADQAGVRGNDLICMIGNRTVASRQDVVDALARYDRVDEITVTLLRSGAGSQHLVTVILRAHD